MTDEQEMHIFHDELNAPKIDVNPISISYVPSVSINKTYDKSMRNKRTAIPQKYPNRILGKHDRGRRINGPYDNTELYKCTNPFFATSESDLRQSKLTKNRKYIITNRNKMGAINGMWGYLCKVKDIVFDVSMKYSIGKLVIINGKKEYRKWFGGSCFAIWLYKTDIDENKTFFLTAAHNFIDYNNKEGIGELIEQYVHINDDDHWIDGFIIHPKYDGEPDCGYDFAVMWLNKKLNIDGLELSVVDAGDYGGNKISLMKGAVYGYPVSKNGMLWGMEGGLQLKNQIIQYDLDTRGGQSGSPILAYAQTEVMIVGIHDGAYHHIDRNFGTRLTKEKINWIRKQCQ